MCDNLLILEYIESNPKYTLANIKLSDKLITINPIVNKVREYIENQWK